MWCCDSVLWGEKCPRKLELLFFSVKRLGFKKEVNPVLKNNLLFPFLKENIGLKLEILLKQSMALIWMCSFVH